MIKLLKICITPLLVVCSLHLPKITDISATTHFSRSWKASTSWRMPCNQSGMSCHRIQSTRRCRLTSFTKYVLKLAVDTSNIIV